MIEPIQFQMDDISASVFGKYQYCTMHSDGLFYADSDFRDGFGGGPLKAGSLSSPSQFTAEASARAKAMHEAAAKNLANEAIKKLSPQKSLWTRIANIFRQSSRTQ